MKLFTTIMGLLLLGNLGAAELLKNHDFSAKNSNNLPKDWTCRGGAEAFNFDSGTVKMNRKGADNVILQQDKLNIVPGKKYRFSCEVTAPKGTDYMIYYEALLDGKFITEPVVRKAGNGKTEKISCIIVKPLKAKSDRLMIRLMNQSGIEVSNLHLDEETESVQSKSDEHGIFFDAPSPDKKDVLYNGNMERGPARWELLPGARVVRTNDRLGNRGLELAAKGIAGQKGLFLESNQKWRLTFFAKNTSDSPEAQFNVFFRSNDFNSNPERKLFTVKSNQYQRYEIIFQIPGNGERKMINLFCENPGKATVILDEFYLDAPANQPKVALKFDPEFWRGFLYQSLNQPKLTGFAETTLPQAAKIVVSLKKDHAVLNKVTLTPANLKFTFPVENLANGDYLLIGEVFDANNKLCGQTELPFKKLPPVANEVLIDSKQNFIVDGKRFYPIALLDVYDRPGTNYMGYISARNGVNALFSRLIFDEAGALKALDYAKSLGLKSILCIGGFKEIAIGRDFKRQWQEKINKILTPAVISHEALFIYEYGDEGVGNDIPDAAYVEAIKIMNEVDPYHPVFLNESPRGTVVEYLKKHSAGAAVFGVDIYPVPESIRHSCLPNKP